MSWAPALILLLLAFIVLVGGIWYAEFRRTVRRHRGNNWRRYNRIRTDVIRAPRPACVVSNWNGVNPEART